MRLYIADQTTTGDIAEPECASETMSCAPLLMIDNSFTEAKYCRARSPASMIRFLANSNRSGSFIDGI
jgi:hypothetical protein